MDLGCIDLGCIEKRSNETFLDPENEANDPVMATARVGKTKALKEAGQSNVSALNKFTLQIKKPLHRKSSPINWFPRKKVDSYLKRKIKLLQEVSGMNSTLDETLGDSNPHYSRVLKEKIAVREATYKAMEARKAAMVEASWCRILRAARIQNKEAEFKLLEAEKSAVEAFEAATAIGVIMYDIPDLSGKHYEIETSSANGGGSTTHRVTASFETAFEVDKQVAAAVKLAFNRLANCTSIKKDEFKELLRKISQNPDAGEKNQDLLELSSEYESDTGSEFESGSHKDGLNSQDLNCEIVASEVKQRKYKMRQLSEKFNMAKLVDMIQERLRCLQEDELASLATIVATSGLNAALTEAENGKVHDSGFASDFTSPQALTDGQIRRKQNEAELPSLDKFLVKHMTKLEKEVQEAKNTRRSEIGKVGGDNPDKFDIEQVNSVNNTSSSETAVDLGSILVKHFSKLEKEIEEAKRIAGNIYEKEQKNCSSQINSIEVVPDLGSILTKHSSKLEKEVEEARKKHGKSFEMNGKKLDRLQNGEITNHRKQDITEIPSLDKYLVKHVSKLEREIQEAKNRKIVPNEGNRLTDFKRKSTSITTSSGSHRQQAGKENIDLNKNEDKELEMKQDETTRTLPPRNMTDRMGDSLIHTEEAEALSAAKAQDEIKETENSLASILVKPVHRLEREKMHALSLGTDYRCQRYQKKCGANNVTDFESLDAVLVKHVSRLEKEKMGLMKEEAVKVERSDRNTHLENTESSLEHILVKHKSRLEKEKMDAAQQPQDQINLSVARREARERELQKAWGGLSLGNAVRPHLSRLERDKAAWLKAEEDERRRAMEL